MVMLRERTIVTQVRPCISYPHCGNAGISRVRGLCRACYNAYREAKKAGITEEALINSRKILPAYGGQTLKSYFKEVSSS